MPARRIEGAEKHLLETITGASCRWMLEDSLGVVLALVR